MPLIEYTLWGKRDKVQKTIDRMRAHEPREGYYLAFSGGKDSVALYHLAVLSGVRFDAHYNDTTVDPPEVKRFMRAHFPDVQRHKPDQSMFQLLFYHKWPPMRQSRWCCRDLKERGGDARVVMTGIRWEESYNRSKRKMVETCYRNSTKTYFNPIIDWTEADIWEFHETEDLPHCCLYDEGFTRIGCVLCPMCNNPKRDIERWPKFANAWIISFDRLIQFREENGLKTSFRTGEELFQWWIQRRVKKKNPDQRSFDFSPFD